MKFLLFILVIIDNLNVFLANNDNCGVNDLNALMVCLRQLRTEFNNLKIQHAEQINATQAEIKALKEEFTKEINNKSSEIKLIKEENRKQETELEELRQDVNNKSLEIAAISKEIEIIKDIDDCNPDPCQNGATCTDGVDSYTCMCVAGYTGTNCETAKCPADWYFFRESCYFYSTKILAWLEAENDCIDLGGHLVEITSEEENNFIKSILSVGVQSILSVGDRFWIGLNDRVSENVFVWVSSGNNASGVYTDWKPGEPNDYDNQDCVFISHYRGGWFDAYCSYTWPYICEKESMFV